MNVSDAANTSTPKPDATTDRAPVDLLAEAIARVRPLVADTKLSPRQRLQVWWAGAVEARDYAARDVWGNDFVRLAVESGLLRCLPRYSSAIILLHVLQWAWINKDPWR